MAFLIIFMLLFSLTACSSLKRISIGGKDEGENINEGPPQDMQSLERDLNELVDRVERQALKTSEDKSQAQGSSDSTNEKNKAGGSDDSVSRQSDGNNTSKGGPAEEKTGQTNGDSNDISDMMPELERNIGTIHKIWNRVQPELLKKGADRADIDAASDALNRATATMDSKDGLAFLKTINQFYRYIPDIEENMHPQTPPGLMRITYYARNILYGAFEDDQKTVSGEMPKIEDEWAAVKPQLKKGSESQINQLEVSIDELQNSLEEQNKNLIKIKTDIVLDDIKALVEKQKK
jgi:TolA-binding protein